MKMMISQEEFNKNKSRNTIPLQCEYCNKVFHKEKHHIQKAMKKNRWGHAYKFCSTECFGKNKTHNSTLEISCSNCGKNIRKTISNRRSERCFCSSSCAATYNNTHKTKGNRRSKIEKWIEDRLTQKYPQLEIHYNKTDAINSEIDIYIPSLKLAFELNGIFHYEPIYGEEKLKSTKTNDDRKFQACLERGIELCIIDISSQKYFKESNSQKFLSIIQEVLEKKVGAVWGNRNPASTLAMSNSATKPIPQ